MGCQSRASGKAEQATKRAGRMFDLDAGGQSGGRAQFLGKRLVLKGSQPIRAATRRRQWGDVGGQLAMATN